MAISGFDPKRTYGHVAICAAISGQVEIEHAESVRPDL
jgi:surface antigen